MKMHIMPSALSKADPYLRFLPHNRWREFCRRLKEIHAADPLNVSKIIAVVEELQSMSTNPTPDGFMRDWSAFADKQTREAAAAAAAAPAPGTLPSGDAPPGDAPPGDAPPVDRGGPSNVQPKTGHKTHKASSRRKLPASTPAHGTSAATPTPGELKYGKSVESGWLCQQYIGKAHPFPGRPGHNAQIAHEMAVAAGKDAGSVAQRLAAERVAAGKAEPGLAMMRQKRPPADVHWREKRVASTPFADEMELGQERQDALIEYLKGLDDLAFPMSAVKKLPKDMKERREQLQPASQARSIARLRGKMIPWFGAEEVERKAEMEARKRKAELERKAEKEAAAEAGAGSTEADAAEEVATEELESDDPESDPDFDPEQLADVGDEEVSETLGEGKGFDADEISTLSEGPARPWWTEGEEFWSEVEGERVEGEEVVESEESEDDDEGDISDESEDDDDGDTSEESEGDGDGDGDGDDDDGDGDGDDDDAGGDGDGGDRGDPTQPQAKGKKRAREEPFTQMHAEGNRGSIKASLRAGMVKASTHNKKVAAKQAELDKKELAAASGGRKGSGGKGGGGTGGRGVRGGGSVRVSPAGRGRPSP